MSSARPGVVHRREPALVEQRLAPRRERRGVARLRPPADHLAVRQVAEVEPVPLVAVPVDERERPDDHSQGLQGRRAARRGGLRADDARHVLLERHRLHVVTAGARPADANHGGAEQLRRDPGGVHAWRARGHHDNGPRRAIGRRHGHDEPLVASARHRCGARLGERGHPAIRERGRGAVLGGAAQAVRQHGPRLGAHRHRRRGREAHEASQQLVGGHPRPVEAKRRRHEGHRGGRRRQAHLTEHAVERAAGQAFGDRGEVVVARMRQRFRRADGTAEVGVRAGDAMAGDLDLPTAEDARIGRDDARLEGRDERRHLDDRAGQDGRRQQLGVAGRQRAPRRQLDHAEHGRSPGRGRRLRGTRCDRRQPRAEDDAEQRATAPGRHRLALSRPRNGALSCQIAGRLSCSWCVSSTMRRVTFARGAAQTLTRSGFTTGSRDP